MKVTATKLRSELHQILDRVLETGEPVEVTRPAGTLVIAPRGTKRKPRPNRNLVVGDPDELVHFDWAPYWKD